MMQDYIGFTYNDKHSIKDLKIYRTSNDRYDDNITATMIDKTIDVPGGDGQYYFGTTFKNRIFTVTYAFDDLTESDIRLIKQTFSGDGIHELVFDERPYMAWSAKVTGTASMKHLCFDEDGIRKYKGEGSITFTCYHPFARTPKKLWRVYRGVWTYSEYEANNTTKIDGKKLSDYTEDAYTNRGEWRGASGLVDMPVLGYNPGDLPSPFILTTSTAVDANTPLTVGAATITIASKTTGPVVWDSKTGLVYQITENNDDATKTLIPYTGNSIATIPINKDNTKEITVTPKNATLTYDYLYR